LEDSQDGLIDAGRARSILPIKKFYPPHGNSNAGNLEMFRALLATLSELSREARLQGRRDFLGMGARWDDPDIVRAVIGTLSLMPQGEGGSARLKRPISGNKDQIRLLLRKHSSLRL